MKKNWKFRIVSVLLVAILSLSLLAACGNTPSATVAQTKTEETAITAEPKKDVTLILAASQNWIKDIDRKLASDFVAKTGIKIDFQVNPDDQYATILKTKIASGEGPDIFMCQAGLGMDQFIPEKNFADLSNEPWVARYNSWAKASTTKDGKVVGLNTWGVDGWVTVYDPDLFAKYNVAIPTNYKELLSACETFKSNGIIPMYTPVKDVWQTPMYLAVMAGSMLKDDPEILNKLNAGTAKFADNKIFNTAMAQVKEMADKGYFGANYMSDTWDKTYEMLATGKTAMLVAYTAYPSEVLVKFPNSNAAKYKAFVLPLADSTSFTFNGGGEMKVMFKDTENADSVKEFFNFLTTTDSLNAYYAERKDLVGSSFKDVTGNTTEAYNSSLAIADLSATELYASVSFFDLMTVGKHMQEMLVKGGITPEKAVQAIDVDREKMLKATAK